MTGRRAGCPTRVGGVPEQRRRAVAVPTLPLIDLMILVAWTCLIVAVVQKALWMALVTRASVFGMTPYDFVLVAGVSLLFALALAARVWVKANEALLRSQRAPRPLDEVLPDFPDPHGRKAKPRGEAPGDGEAPGPPVSGPPGPHPKAAPPGKPPMWVTRMAPV
jgi:hypothetical protein